MTLNPVGSQWARAFVAQMRARAEQGEPISQVWRSYMLPDCVINIDNGDRLTADEWVRLTHSTEAAFPDMELSIDRALFLEDRALIQLTLSATISPGLPGLQAGARTMTRCAMMARAVEGPYLSEVWTHINPGFQFTFPPTGVSEPPPLHDGAGVAEARHLLEHLVREAASTDLFQAVLGRFAADGVVHMGNGDDGPVGTLRALLDQVRSALDDLRVEVDDIAVIEGHVMARYRMQGVHIGPIGPYLPTGRTLPSRGLFLARPNRAGEIAELWFYISPVYALSVAPRQ